MSRNRESWLLSLALPHIPFLSLVKSFPFTFPPGLYFGGEKTQALASAQCLKPPLARHSTEHRSWQRLQDAQGAVSALPAQTDPSRARPFLCSHPAKRGACEQAVPRSVDANHILAHSSPRPLQQAAEQEGKLLSRAATEAAAQLHAERCSGQPTCKEVALKPVAARTDEGRYSNERSRVRRGKKKPKTQPNEQPEEGGWSRGARRAQPSCSPADPSCGLPRTLGRGKTSRQRQEQGALCGFARYFRPSPTQEELCFALRVSPSLARITNLASGPGLGSSRAPHQTG